MERGDLPPTPPWVTNDEEFRYWQQSGYSTTAEKWQEEKYGREQEELAGIIYQNAWRWITNEATISDEERKKVMDYMEGKRAAENWVEEGAGIIAKPLTDIYRLYMHHSTGQVIDAESWNLLQYIDPDGSMREYYETDRDGFFDIIGDAIAIIGSESTEVYSDEEDYDAEGAKPITKVIGEFVGSKGFAQMVGIIASYRLGRRYIEQTPRIPPAVQATGAYMATETLKGGLKIWGKSGDALEAAYVSGKAAFEAITDPEEVEAMEEMTAEDVARAFADGFMEQWEQGTFNLPERAISYIASGGWPFWLAERRKQRGIRTGTKRKRQG